MRKIISAILCFAFVSLTACSKQPAQNSRDTLTDVKVKTETQESRGEKSEPSEALENNIAATLVKEAPKLLANKELQMQELEAKELFYTSYLGVRKTFPNTLPMPLAYENDKLYYMGQRVPDEMSAEERDKALKK